MQIIFRGKLSDWEAIKLTIFNTIGQSDFKTVGEFEEAIRVADVEIVNEALSKAGHEAEVQL